MFCFSSLVFSVIHDGYVVGVGCLFDGTIGPLCCAVLSWC